MLDRNLLVDEFENTKSKLMLKKVPSEDIDSAREAIIERRKIAAVLDEQKAHLNKQSASIATLLRAGKNSEVDDIKAGLVAVKNKIASMEQELEVWEKKVELALLTLPNLPDSRAPIGTSEADNKVLYHRGPDLNTWNQHKIPPHWEIAETLGLLDSKRASKLSGSMFAVLRGDGTKLLRALLSFAVKLNDKRYEEVICPHFVTSATLTATGHLPKFSDEAFHISRDDLWAIPTGEVPLTALHTDEIIPIEQLPIRYMTHTSCFRREAGSAGKETRGMQRLHEFRKLELVHLVAPEEGDKAFQDLLLDCEEPIKQLGLPYRILDLCCGDMTFSSARTHDIEVFSPGVQRWLEVSSVGLFTDFQARRGRIRLRRDSKSKPEPLYTLNGSGLATPRVFAAILECGYQADSRVKIPKVLQPYMEKEYLG